MSKVYVEDIWAEDLFYWFWETVARDGGDGGAVITCGNYQETANYFLVWYKSTYNRDLLVPNLVKRDEYKSDNGANIINFHDGNENLIFSDKEVKLWPYEYNYIVKTDLVFGHGINSDGERVIRAAQI